MYVHCMYVCYYTPFCIPYSNNSACSLLSLISPVSVEMKRSSSRKCTLASLFPVAVTLSSSNRDFAAENVFCILIIFYDLHTQNIFVQSKK